MDKMNFTTNRANGPKQEWYEAHTFTKGSWERMNITGTEKRRRNNIQYPLAYQPIFDVIHVNDAEKGSRYLCLGCDQEMIPRKGRIKKHHFAHKADLEQCNPDNALHETAKAAICHGFLTALEEDKSYPVKFPCDRCREPIPVNVAVEGAGIATERTAIKGTRSDLVITKEDGRTPRVIIEIVVHHDLDVDTEEKYKGSGIAVIKIRPTWETVEALRKEINAGETLNVKNTACQSCTEKARLHRQWLADTEEELRNTLLPNHGNHERIEQIIKDRYGSYLRADTRRRVNENARRLATVGFSQQKSRPTLFKLQVNHWAIYADLDSTEVMRIWEVDCAPGLYAFPEDTEPPRCRECVLDIVRRTLEYNRIEIRRYFMDSGTHNHWIPEHDDCYRD